MAKLKQKQKKTWFSLIKRFFVSDSQSRTEKDKKKRWVFRLLKIKGSAEKLPWQTKEHSSINTLPVIIAIDTPIPNKAAMGSSSRVIIPKLSQESASTKIQAAFRGYLARKALRALKGVVKLQALIRGWAVRQQAINTLKCLQSIVNIQSEVCSKRRETIKDSVHCQEQNSRVLRENKVKVSCPNLQVHLNTQKRRDDSTLTKEELKELIQTKIKRERVKEYYLNHRRSAETERETAHGRRRYWLEQWVDAQLAKSLTPAINSNSRNKYQPELLDSPLCNTQRSYHHRKQRSTGEDNLFLGSPSVPAYMASTESAKARARSMSSPRLRPLSFDACSETLSPYKNKLSPMSSINSEMTSSSWVGNHRRSPCLRGAPGPIKSTTSHRHNC